MKPILRDAPKGSIPLGEDIMQLARMGEIGAMQNMFAAKKLTANHRDEEGITPLHVCFRFYYLPEKDSADIGTAEMCALSDGVVQYI